ncbi:zinc finger protein 438 isoform X2 [Macrotis lagotis]|uniref:zinc finger protein 438 isoform X2 n=1 Tax=Macrotis lagotis TaxID=92651 RepID=UPI003D696717
MVKLYYLQTVGSWGRSRRKTTFRGKDNAMENSLLVPPKDQDEAKISPWTTQTGKTLQNKIQFRTIAPKITPKVLTSPVLPYQSPSLSDQVHPISSSNSRPLVVPPQNYALMQVAGQEGTFSLVALPQVTPTVTTQPIQKPKLSLPKNLKLPIPRYQPTRNKKVPEVETIPNSSVSVIRKVPANTQTCAQPSPSIANHSELQTNIDSSEHVILIDQVPTEITVTALLDEGSCAESGPPLANKPEAGDTVIIPKPWVPKETSAELGRAAKVDLGTKTVTRESALSGEKIKEGAADSARAITVLSPAILGNTVQLMPTAPKGKLPILPYSRMKAAMFCKTKPHTNVMGPASSWHRSDCDKVASFAKTFNVSNKASEKLFAVSLTQASKPMPCEDAFRSTSKVELDNKKKLNGGTAKRRGRKRKIPDEILAFQTKKRKCILDTCRDGKERVKTDSQELRDRKTGAVKKYRNIMPKPVIVMQAVAPLTPPAPLLQAKSPEGLERDSLLNNSLTNKFLISKQSDSTSTKPGTVCKNGFSAIKKPWHKCHICNHHFQFKHHLQDHMNTHTNRRPYSCRICRKAYVHSGSLSTHMKLHHGESRLKKLMYCEFCAKVFGHIRVYFGHLKEVHRVVINTEPSSGELPQGKGPKNREMGIRGAEEAGERENKSNLEETFFPGQPSEVKLDIKCGRCQVTAQSFSEMKFHLLYVHGEDIQGKLKEGILPGSKGTQEEVVKRAAHFWKQHSERRSLVRRDALEEELYAFPIQLKREIYLLHQKNLDILTKNEEVPPGASEPGKALPSPDGAMPSKIQLWSSLGFNCLLCKQILERKEELFLHWEQQHNCEDPSVLWALLSALSSQGVIEFSNEAEK